MELFELKYFLAVARHESVQAGARAVHVSAGSLSKAVAKLEEELGVALFVREGRGLRLTEEGRILVSRASHIVALEERAREELRPHAPHVVLAGTELHLACFAIDVIALVEAAHPGATFDLRATASEQESIAELLDRRADGALTAGAAPEGTCSRHLGTSVFVTCVGRGHPLWPRAERGEVVPIAEVLEHGFVAPEGALVGRVSDGASPDGWRDDQFPRTIRYQTSRLEVLARLVGGGRALAYLPKRCARTMNAVPISISGCPFHCKQRVRFVFGREPARGLAELVV